MIIGILGKKGSGKDTSADYIVEKYSYHKYSFAKPLKEICRILFGFTDEQLYGDKKEVIDPYWKITPRVALQYIGTDLFRNQLKNIMPHINDDIWVNVFEANHNDNNVVIADCRFQNEVDKIKKMNGIIIKLIRDTHSIDSHSSENIDNVTDFDYIIHNNGSIQDLYNEIDKIMICL